MFHDIFKLFAALVVLYVLHKYVKEKRSPLNAIPTVGPQGLLGSYIGAVQSLYKGQDFFQMGYDKYYGSTFKISTLTEWLVVVTTPKLIDELRKAPDDVFSFKEAIAESLQIEYTLGPGIRYDHYHASSVRTPLTRNLAIRFSDVQDEIASAFSELVPATEEWSPIPAYNTMMQITCRSSNRLFVGLPLCRDPDYLRLNERFTILVVTTAKVLRQFPPFIRPLLARCFTNIGKSTQRATRHLEGMIQEQLDMDERHGSDRPERPNNLISWLLDYAHGYQRTVHDMVTRVLTVNFTAIHTTTIAVTNVLLDLAAQPEYVEPLREEITAVIEAEGWTKEAMGKLHKLDSFVKESQRMSGLTAMIMNRKALKGFTFSDGTFVPAGTTVVVPQLSVHFDKANYEDPYSFRGFRFSDMQADDGDDLKHQAVSLGLDWVTFGSGRHACPGRFFAINEIKAMLCYILLNYDVKTVDGARPTNTWLGLSSFPSSTANILFRKRGA